MAHGQVGPRDDGAEVGEHGPEVIGLADPPTIGPGPLQDRSMGEHVAGGDQGEPTSSAATRTPGLLCRPGPDRGQSSGGRRPGPSSRSVRDQDEEQDAEAAYDLGHAGSGRQWRCQRPAARRANAAAGMCPVITVPASQHLDLLREPSRSGSLGRYSPVLWEVAQVGRANLARRPVPGIPIDSPSGCRRPLDEDRVSGVRVLSWLDVEIGQRGDQPLATAVDPRGRGRSIR